VRGLTSNGQVHLADPAFGNHTVSVAEFQGVWKEGIAFAVSR
jgi:predicted double-glycine peptidase